MTDLVAGSRGEPAAPAEVTPADAVLDNAVWHALAASPPHLVERVDGAARFRPDVAPFHAVDRLDPSGWRALEDLAGPGRGLVLFRDEVGEAPPGWERIGGGAGHQLVLRELRAPDPVPGLRPLGDGDVDQMVDLVRRTEPGPFLARTIELGGYVGVFDGARLVAMAGRRLQPSGYTEVSAVCTDPGFTGRGYARALTAAVAVAALDRGDRVLLHVATSNERARQVYERLGFELRRTIDLAVLRTPRGPVG